MCQFITCTCSRLGDSEVQALFEKKALWKQWQIRHMRQRLLSSLSSTNCALRRDWDLNDIWSSAGGSDSKMGNIPCASCACRSRYLHPKLKHCRVWMRTWGSYIIERHTKLDALSIGNMRRQKIMALYSLSHVRPCVFEGRQSLLDKGMINADSIYHW